MRACVRAACVCVCCFPRHVAIAIDLCDVAARAKERGGDGDSGFLVNGPGRRGGARVVQKLQYSPTKNLTEI